MSSVSKWLSFCRWAAAETLAAELPAVAKRDVRFGRTIPNTSDYVVPEAELWECVPLPETLCQSRPSLNVSHPHEVHDKGLGNRVLKLVFSNVLPFAVRLVTLDIKLLGAATDRQEPDPAYWLASGPLQKPDDEACEWPAPAMDGMTPKALLRRLFNWVRGYTQPSAYHNWTKFFCQRSLTSRRSVVRCPDGSQRPRGRLCDRRGHRGVGRAIGGIFLGPGIGVVESTR